MQRGKNESGNLVVDEEEGYDLQLVDNLQNEGIAAADIAKLKAAGINTIEGLNSIIRKTLLEVRGISDAKADKILEAAAKLSDKEFFTATEVIQKRKKLFMLATGCDQLNKILGGGIESGSITELCGEFRTGKTQLCHTLCITCQIPDEKGRGGGKALYIDTENTFRPERLEPIAERFGLDPEAAVENVLYARAKSSDHQNKLLFTAAQIMVKEKFSLIVVDSATALFRTDYSGRGELAARQMSLAKFLRNLQRLADEFGVAVVVSNQMVANVDASMGADKKPIGGNIMAHACQTRLYLRKGAKENRVCKVFDSPSVPEAEATFAITEQGVNNPTD